MDDFDNWIAFGKAAALLCVGFWLLWMWVNHPVILILIAARALRRKV